MKVDSVLSVKVFDSKQVKGVQLWYVHDVLKEIRIAKDVDKVDFDAIKHGFEFYAEDLDHSLFKSKK